ncbi:hypothetical protein QBC34DRAFT_359484 [Podospora aff. communis PSN243]|uniref:Uncharacterized protein n=1 Tax=Podospora aff. communis PSN243 TaxID=3040156 RepID=A0AAV9G8G5_9PEZI|nr:hypothetical protein QBC34DRAFT_359484 [Podospora aff. communis PSN243]
MTTIFEPAGSSPPNPFSAILAPFHTSATNPNPDLSPSTLTPLAANLTNAVTTSRNPASALWQLWDAIFIPCAKSPASHTPTLALLRAIRAQPPSLPDPQRTEAGTDAANELSSHTDAEGKLVWAKLPRFGWSWRDFHDILEANREWKHRGEGRYFTNFVEFSARFLQEVGAKGEIGPIFVFYACAGTLEQGNPPKPKEGKGNERKFSEWEVWEMDVKAVGLWVKYGGEVLWGVDREELRRGSEAVLEAERELWPRRDGLVRERWVLWAERLRGLGREEGLGEETRGVVNEAAEVVEGLLARV